MNRREFLQSLLGAAAVAALPVSVLAKAEEAAAPIADAAVAWTPGPYWFSIFVKRTNVLCNSTILDAKGWPIKTPQSQWQRVAFQLSQEIGDAMCGKDATSKEAQEVLQRVLQIVQQDKAEMKHAQLEYTPVKDSAYTSEYISTGGFHRNELLYSDRSLSI